MQIETSRISCQNPKCEKRSVGIVEQNGEKFLLMKFRHNNEQHQQKLSLKDIVKKEFTKDELLEIVATL